MNADHTDAILLYATRLLGADDGRWRISGLDPDGADLTAGDRTARLAFPERVTSPGALRQVLVALAKEAREAS
jgi:putative heme iron utilization protein